MRFSDDFPINVIPNNDEEKYIIEEAKLWLDENCFKSSLNPYEQHINNVVNLGRKITPFIIDIMRENNNEEGMYTHFLLEVICRLYEGEIEFKGYCPPSWCMNQFIQLYDNGGFSLIDKVLDDKNDGV